MRPCEPLLSAKCKIICGAPGIGKTSLGMQENIIDLTSSPFRWLDYSESNLEKSKGLYQKKNPNFIPDYLSAIKMAVRKYDVVLLPLLITPYLDEINLNYAIAYQSLSLMDTIRTRLIQRGNTQIFVDEVMNDFVELNKRCSSSPRLKYEISQDNFFLLDAIRDQGWRC